MQNTLPCPKCNRELKVPDQLVGKLVKCPACGTTFTAEFASTPSTPSFEEHIHPDSQPSTPDPVAPEAFDDAYQVDYEPSEFRKRRFYQEALNQVHGPATALMVVGIINCALSALRILAAVFVMGMQEFHAGDPGDEEERMMGLLFGAIGIIYALVGIVAGCIIIVGATKMKKLKGYKFSMTTSILAMIPLTSACCILGLPFGIWSIVVLCKPEVKDAFS